MWWWLDNYYIFFQLVGRQEPFGNNGFNPHCGHVWKRSLGDDKYEPYFGISTFKLWGNPWSSHVGLLFVCSNPHNVWMVKSILLCCPCHFLYCCSREKAPKVLLKQPLHQFARPYRGFFGCLPLLIPTPKGDTLWSLSYCSHDAALCSKHDFIWAIILFCFLSIGSSMFVCYWKPSVFSHYTLRSQSHVPTTPSELQTMSRQLHCHSWSTLTHQSFSKGLINKHSPKPLCLSCLSCPFLLLFMLHASSSSYFSYYSYYLSSSSSSSSSSSLCSLLSYLFSLLLSSYHFPHHHLLLLFLPMSLFSSLSLSLYLSLSLSLSLPLSLSISEVDALPWKDRQLFCSLQILLTTWASSLPTTVVLSLPSKWQFLYWLILPLDIWLWS